MGHTVNITAKETELKNIYIGRSCILYIVKQTNLIRSSCIPWFLSLGLIYPNRHILLPPTLISNEQTLHEGVALTSDRANTINVIYISKLIPKVFHIRKLMQNTDVNIFDGDNQLHLIFYLYQSFITSDKTDTRFTVIFIYSLKQILVFCMHITDKTMCTSIRFSKPDVVHIKQNK
jgi:hypothetical protein